MDSMYIGLFRQNNETVVYKKLIFDSDRLGVVTCGFFVQALITHGRIAMTKARSNVSHRSLKTIRVKPDVVGAATNIARICGKS